MANIKIRGEYQNTLRISKFMANIKNMVTIKKYGTFQNNTWQISKHMANIKIRCEHQIHIKIMHGKYQNNTGEYQNTWRS